MLAQPARLVELIESQSGATQRVAGLAVEPDDSPRRLAFEKMLALAKSGQRLAGVADLRESPGRAGYGVRKVEDDVARAVRGQPCSPSERACVQSLLRRWSQLAATWAIPTG